MPANPFNNVTEYGIGIGLGFRTIATFLKRNPFSKPPLDFKTLQIASPDQLRLGLQRHVQLPELMYAVDDFALGVKEEETFRGQASNANKILLKWTTQKIKNQIQ